jgi:predicted nucleotidyltransferase
MAPAIDPSAADALLSSADEEFARVLARVVAAVEADGLNVALLGGVASSAYGRPRWTKDIDLFCRPEDADHVLRALEGDGFDVERTNPAWIFKAWSNCVLIDVIFKARGNIYLDEAMVAGRRRVSMFGVEVPVVPPEDLVVIKAIVHDEESPRHWHDALSVLAETELDWSYLVERARRGPNRVLSLLHYAVSVDVPVPGEVIDQLHELVASAWRPA